MIWLALIFGTAVGYLLVQGFKKRAAKKRLKELNEPVTMFTPQPRTRND